MTVGISVDSSGAAGLKAGCDTWYSALAGTLPAPALTITRAALEGDHAAATAESTRLKPLWDLFAEYCSYRVTADIAEHLELVAPESLPNPVLGLNATSRTHLACVITELDLAR
ncbi:hypothetical protein GCM10028787_03180 [Brachybacterium horti]